MKARYCIMLLSQHYAGKAWTNHELRSAQERAFKEREEYILPVRLDGIKIPGMRDTVGYVSLKNKTVEDVANLALAKLGLAGTTSAPQSMPTQSTPFIPLPTIRRNFSERDKDVFTDNAFTTIQSYFKAGIEQLNSMSDIEADFQEVTSTKFLCKVYLQGKRKSACTIWYGGSSMMGGGIKYSNEANPDAGSSMNEILSIETEGGGLALKPLLNMSGSRDMLFTQQAAAEYLWAKLIEPLNR